MAELGDGLRFLCAGCVGKLAVLLHAPRARVGEQVIPLLDFYFILILTRYLKSYYGLSIINCVSKDCLLLEGHSGWLEERD